MRFVHSYWTAPRDETFDFTTDLITSAYSVSRIHALGRKIVLHTDSRGKEIFKDIPYDEVYTTLDGLDEKINPNIWSASKFVSMANEPLDSIHIDNDVYIYDDTLLQVNSDIDFLAQHLIKYNNDYDFVRRYVKKICGQYMNVPEEWDWNSHLCLHLGSFAFNNQELKDKVISYYMELAQTVSKQFPTYLYKSNPHLILNLLLEENFLGMMTKNCKIKFICNYEEFKPEHPNGVYEHFAGHCKKIHEDYSKEKLKELNSDLYNIIIK